MRWKVIQVCFQHTDVTDCRCEAYSDALKKAGIMHRDISPYNILIVNTNTEQKGILIDWDHAICINPASTKRGLWRTVGVQVSSPILYINHHFRVHGNSCLSHC